MDFVRVLDAYKRYLNNSDVKAVCDGKIYRGLRKVEAGARTIVGVKGASIADLDSFYSKTPANIKMFKMSNINDFIGRLGDNYDGWSDSAKKLDIYCKAIVFLSLVKLVKFWIATLAEDASATVATTGVSMTVFSRVKTAQQITGIDHATMKTKSPDKPTILYLEMGLKRIISMEVGTDDWDK